MSTKRLPQKLFKYRGFDVRTKRILRDSTLYAPSPLAFNDPFDCHLPISFKASKKVRERKYLQLAERFGKSPDVVMADVAKREREGHFKSLSKPGSQLAERIQAMQDGFGVICLSEKNDDLLMWAHYGDSHRGICLEFEVARSSIFSRAKPVKYATTFPVLNGFTQSDDELRDGSVLSKSRHWRYEKEWRIVFKGIRSYPFPPELLTGVIFGCQASEETKTEVKRLLAGRNPPVHLFQCVRSDRRFELEIKKLR